MTTLPLTGSTRPRDPAALLLSRCDALARASESPAMLVRRALTGAHADASAMVAGWMRESGLEVRVDPLGNVVGRREGASRRTLVIGSHLDTVRDAGKYDGPLGVLAGIAIAGALEGEPLPISIEVAGFSDEEGVRFGRPFLGSRAYATGLGEDDLALRDAEGATLEDAARAFSGIDGPLRDAIDAARAGREIAAYVEIHIEQGPVLEAAGQPLGVVTGIVGHAWQTYRFRGRAGHAGTTPMTLRRDALAGAAELALAVESMARAGRELVATVGRIEASPGGHNVIAGGASLEVDVRSIDEGVLERALGALHAEAEAIAASRGLEVTREIRLRTPPVRCDERLAALLAEALRRRGLGAHALPSGAGHDARALAAIAPVAMLFVRSPEGLSHHPGERVLESDVRAALEVGTSWVRAIAHELGGDGR